jgi:hypothetical protein
MEMFTNVKKYVEEIQLFQQEFNFRFQDMQIWGMINLFSVLYDVNAEIVPAKFRW